MSLPYELAGLLFPDIENGRQPQGPSSIALSNPITDGLQHLVNVGVSNYDLITDRYGVVSGGVTPSVDTIGQSLLFDGSSGALNIGSSSKLAGKEVSISIWARNSGTGNNSLFGAAPGIQGGDQRINVHLPYGGVIYWDFGVITNGGRLSKDAPTLTDGWHHWVFWASGGNSMRIYLDGKLWASQAFGDPAGYSEASDFTIGAFVPVPTYFHGKIANFAAWNRALSAVEIKSLYDASWQYYEPPSLGYFVPAAGGGGPSSHPSTGSLTGQTGAVTGTSVRTRQHPSSGSLTGQTGAVIGTSFIVPAAGNHGTSGGVVAESGSVTGTATHTGNHSAVGVLLGGTGTVTGTATRKTIHDTVGVLLGGTGTITGAVSGPVEGRTLTQADIDWIVESLVARILPVNVVQVVGGPVDGAGSDNDPWGPV